MNKKLFIPFILLLIILSILTLITKNILSYGSVNIILSPHYDDAVLSLGGLMAKKENETIVATFFTKSPVAEANIEFWNKLSGPANRVKEDEDALSVYNAIEKKYEYVDSAKNKDSQEKVIVSSIVKDIKDLIDKNKYKKIFIYGPATFGNKITHPNHQVLHDAFEQAAQLYSGKNIKFFMYEDFPYVYRFENTPENNKMGTLNGYVGLQDHVKLLEIHIELTPFQLSEKIKAISYYTSQVKAFNAEGFDLLKKEERFATNRCKNTEPTWYACEVVYEIER